MAKPDIPGILDSIDIIEHIHPDEYPAFRKVLHHAFYYHNQGWMVFSDWLLNQLIYAQQYMTGRETADYLEVIENRRNARKRERLSKFPCHDPACPCHSDY